MPNPDHQRMLDALATTELAGKRICPQCKTLFKRSVIRRCFDTIFGSLLIVIGLAGFLFALLGSITLVGFILPALFLIAGSMVLALKSRCPSCGTRSTIPADTPGGRSLYHSVNHP